MLAAPEKPADPNTSKIVEFEANQKGWGDDMALVVNNEFSVEGLVQSLDDYLDAKREHDQERDAYTGYSLDFAWQYQIERMIKARDAFNIKLDEYIENKVNSMLKARPVSAAR